MAVKIVQEWSREWPGEWETALRAFSPISDSVTWLAGRWFPMRRGGEDCGRWILSECVPETIIPENMREVTRVLAGPKPSTYPPHERRAVMMLVNDYQWEMYAKHRVWARELWVIQGDHGGHATMYAQEEREILRAKGLPDEPPALGELAYAPFDNRVLKQMIRRNRLIALGNNLDALKKSGGRAAMDADWAASQRAFRQEYVGFLEEQTRGRADLMDWISGKSDFRDALPQATAGEVNAASRVKDEYIETGDLPSAA